VRLPANPDDLDAAWLEGVLREGGVLPAARVRRITSEVIGVGFGLDGTSVRATIDGDGTPATLVVKWCSAENARSEAHFYRAVAPRLELRLATLLGARIDEEGGILVLSDVAPARQGDTLVGATEPESEALTDAMAGFHALWWGAADVPVVAPLPSWVSDDEASSGRIAEAVPRFLAAWAGRLPPAALAFAEQLPGHVTAARAALARAPETLVHADLHLDNVLFLDDGVPVVLDWPSACRGPAALDFARLVVEGLTSAARRDREGRLLHRYLAALESRGVRYGVDRMRADVACVATLLYAAAVRWAAGPHAVRAGVPRVALLAEELVRKCADAATAPACA